MSPKLKSTLNKIMHLVIILNFISGIAYSFYQIFFVFSVSGYIGPLGISALTADPTIFWARRAYAIEAWIAMVGFSIYLAIVTNKRD